ncbi:hypothetical protein ACJIZ3_019663 [Penstemon smallii]|uniref:Uncharacterized protein n=1 Tax=Penstemon smallii TaxID=265156 RepID=A0ABD3T2N2_9LAMI
MKNQRREIEEAYEYLLPGIVSNRTIRIVNRKILTTMLITIPSRSFEVAMLITAKKRSADVCPVQWCNN